MAEKSILFKGQMVKAILDGRKSVTRRIVKPQPPINTALIWGPEWYETSVIGKDGELKPGALVYGISDDDGEWGIKCPYRPGDVLWVRETTYLYGQWIKNGTTTTGKQKWRFMWDRSKPVFYAENPPNDIKRLKTEIGYFKRPSIFMPRKAARLFLRVKSVRVEWLQEIPEADAIAEGIGENPVQPGTWIDYPEGTSAAGWKDPVQSFRTLWDSLHGKGAWDLNPFVFAYQFEVIKDATTP